MNLGVTLAEYERTVGPRNKLFHETAASVRLHREGILPLDDDTDDGLPSPADVDGDRDDPLADVETHGTPD